jgi:hypothetical protein
MGMVEVLYGIQQFAAVNKQVSLGGSHFSLGAGDESGDNHI